VSKSGTLTYEAVGQLTALGIGQSTCVGVGGDPINGTDFIDVMKLFKTDPGHGRRHSHWRNRRQRRRDRREWIKDNFKKPVAGFIAGRTAPPGKRMGHAGAIISGGTGGAEEKIAALEAAGVRVAPTPSDMASTLKSMM
jgi:succinyl-CoA synthetase alpha subunit